MSQDLEEQQRLTHELKEQLRTLEDDRLRITQQIGILEAKLMVQELRDKVRIKTEVVNELQARKQELEEKLQSRETTLIPQEQVDLTPNQEEIQRSHF
jgi:hypothetical protein